MRKVEFSLKETLKYADIWILLVILAAFIGVFSGLRPGFLSLSTLESMCFQFPELGILTIAMAVTMIVGGINLSCIASANLSAIVMVLIMNRYIPEDADSFMIVFAAIIAGILLSVLIGVLNGIIIACFNVPDILATLSTQLLIGGLNLVITGGTILSVPSNGFRYIGNGDLMGIPVPVLLFIACLIVAVIVMSKTAQGKSMYLYGANPVASRFNGTGRVGLIIKTYAFSGLFVGIAAVLMTSRFNSASAEYASSYLLQTVLVSVLAGINPDGGKGRMATIIIAIFLIQVISSGFNILRIDSHLGTALWGVILILSVVFNGRFRQRLG